MSSVTQPVQGPKHQPMPVQPATALTAKRPAADDEVEFISSCPVKKPRLKDQKPDPEVVQPQPQNTQVQAQQTPVNHQEASSQPLPSKSTSATVNAGTERWQTTQIPSRNPTPGLGPEPRATSLPILENFAFPQNFPPITCPPRMSVAISPKQTPQAMPSTNHAAPLLADTSVTTNCNPLPGPDQVPCFDFNGIATTSCTGFEMNQVFPPSNDNALMNNSTVVPNQMTNPTPFGPNAIPFTMYSMGNIVPMSQQNTNPSANIWMNPRSMQTQIAQGFRQNNTPMPVKQQQTHPQQTFMPTAPQVAPARPRCSFSVHSPSQNHNSGKPPCLHCTVLRQEHIRRHQHPSHPPPPLHNCQQCQPPHLPFATQTFQPAPTLHPPPPPPPIALTPTSEQQIPTNKRKFSIPLRKKPTQNLQLDIAETAEEIFPYDEVAARHGVTPQKVFDTLSAIVLIPLLRCPTDKRRAGKLAHERAKQLTQLKNDMGKEKGDVVTVQKVREFFEGGGSQQGKN